MTPARPQLVHESETQRQHVRMTFPAQAELNGTLYPVKDLSPAGLSLRGIEGPYKVRQKIPLSLKFPFPGFALNIELEAEVQHYNAREKFLGCRFVNLLSDQIALLNHILKAFMAGDVTSSQDLLTVVARDNFVKLRKPVISEEVKINWRKQITGLSIIFLLGLAATIFLIGNAYENLYSVQSQDAYVSGPLIEVRAPTSGIYTSQLTPEMQTVQAGQQIGAIAGGAPNILPQAQSQIESPCQCYISERNKQSREYVHEGDILLSLAPNDATPWVVAEVDSAHASRIGDNNRAIISINGSKAQFTGHVATMKSGMNAADTNESGFYPRPIQIRVIPDQSIPVRLIGRPAKVTFPVE